MSTIDLIQEAFNNHNIKYRIVETEQLSFIDAGYNIQGGPTVRFHFISQDRDDSNDVQIRIFGLLNKISADKRGVILEACNRINSELRFLKFYVDKEGNLSGQADLPTKISEDCVGECCFELFVRSMQILDQCYHYFPEAYYSAAAVGKRADCNSAAGHSAAAHCTAADRSAAVQYCRRPGYSPEVLNSAAAEAAQAHPCRFPVPASADSVFRSAYRISRFHSSGFRSRYRNRYC